MVIESPVPQEQPLAASVDSVKATYSEAHTTPPESGPMAAAGDSAVNGVDPASEAQRQQQANNMSNGVHGVYPYPYPPPGAMYPVPQPEMYQGASGPRMMAPMPYPYPPSQPGQPGQHLPPNGYAFPTMMAPPPQGGNNGASPTSPTGPPAQYPFMWYPPPGMAMPPPPPGMVSQNGLPVPMNSPLPPPNYHPHPSQNQAESQGVQHGMDNGVQQQQQQQQQQHQHQQQQQQQPHAGENPNGAAYPPGPGGLPPKEVAKTIPCRYFPDCRFGSSCWFLHPGAEPSNQTQPHPQQENQPPRPYFSGPLPPPVRYGPSGPWDPSTASPITNGAAPDANKNAYPTPPANNAGTYGLMYAPYPYTNGYPAPYPPQQQSTPGPAGSAPQSPPQAPQPMSPQHYAQSMQQNPPSQSQSPSIPTPPTGIPVMYAPNGMPGPWYPAPGGPYPPQNMPMQGPHPGQPLSPSQQPQNMGPLPMSPISPSMGPGSQPVQSMGMSQPISPVGPPLHMHPNSIPYPISPPYTSPRLQPKSPSQMMHPLSPQTHPGSPQSLYGHQQPPPPPSMPVMPGHHSRRESMSSMSAVPMGAVLGAHLDGNTNVDATRSPPSAFREMDGGFARRGRGGHSQRGSWGGNGFGPNGNRKPPCAFYPAGKCKNGDQCRFPHIMPDENAPISPVSPRGGYPGSFGRMANGRRPTILGPIEDKMADLSVKEQNEGTENSEAGPRSAKPYSSPKIRPGRAPLSTPSTPINRQNAHLQSHQPTPSQRLPSADDFPVLGGTATPPSGNGATYGSPWGGPTAAQVLKGIGAKKAANGNGATLEGGKDFRAPSEGDHTVDDPFRIPEKSANGSL